MHVDSIKNGIVIDHITAGRGMTLYKLMKLDQVDCSVALINNVNSRKMGKKDIIKIDNIINIDYSVLGFIDPNITVNVIKNEQIAEKITLSLPEKVENVIKCKNPRCITTTENYVSQIFHLVDKEKGQYRCGYCDELTSSRNF